MPAQRYTVTPHPIETILAWVKAGEIAIAEIQRPFVWDATQVRNLKAHYILEGFETMDLDDFPSFLEGCRRLMPRKLQAYDECLGSLRTQFKTAHI